MLVGTAGFAAAEVTVSGNARMGIVNDGNDTQFTNRVRATVSMSGDTDGGLSFGGSFGIHNAGAAAGGTSGSVFISGAFGKLSMGDVDSAFGATFGNIAGVGLTGLGDRNELSHSADGGGFGKIPSIYTNGVVRQGGYNALFSLNAAKTQYTSTTAKVSGFGADAALVWGPLFDNAAFNTALTGFVDADLVAVVNPNGSVTPAALGEGAFDGAIFAGFQATIDKLALKNKSIAADTAGAQFTAPFNFYLPNSVFKAENQAMDEDAGNAYLDLSISTAGVTAIPARVLYEYSMSEFAVAASYSQIGSNEAYSLAGSYTTGGLKLSAGIANAQWNDAIKATVTLYSASSAAVPAELANGTTAIMAKSSATTAHDLEADDLNFGVSYTMGNITLAGVTQRREFSLNGSEVDQIDSTGLSVAYAANGLGVSAYMMSTDGTVSADSDNYGVGASYDLGGGASVSGGVAGGDADTVYDIGLNFTF